MYFQYIQIIYYYKNFESINVDKIVETNIHDKQVNVVSTSFELLFKFIFFENLNHCIQCETKDLRKTRLNLY